MSQPTYSSGRLTTQVNAVPARTSGAKSANRKLSWAFRPNKQILRSETRFAVVYQALTTTRTEINAPNSQPKSSGIGLARASCTAAEAIFGNSTSSHNAGNRIIQFKIRFRPEIATAAQVSLDINPSLGVR